MNKILIIIITLLFISNCGFQRISNDRLNNFQVKNFLVSGDTKIANRIKNNLMINIRKESPNLISLSLDLKKTKNISEKNSANQITKYSINLIANVVLINEINNKIDKIKISEAMSYNVENTYTQSLKNEQQIILDLSGKITEEILKYIYLKI
tara:strand:+ start:278 stop:736 length:459 start_codon:yes stop_codon:yes gene_type:complete